MPEFMAPVSNPKMTATSANYFGCEPVRKGPEIFGCLRGQLEPTQTTRCFASSFISPKHHSLTAVRVRLKLASIKAKLDTRPL